MKQKVICLMKYDGGRFKKGVLNSEKKAIEIRLGLTEKIAIAVPDGVEGVPMKRGGRVFFVVDLKKLVAIPLGDVIINDEKLTVKIGILLRTQYWKYLANKSVDLITTLIYFAAGYGILRFAEYIIQTLTR